MINRCCNMMPLKDFRIKSTFESVGAIDYFFYVLNNNDEVDIHWFRHNDSD